MFHIATPPPPSISMTTPASGAQLSSICIIKFSLIRLHKMYQKWPNTDFQSQIIFEQTLIRLHKMYHKWPNIDFQSQISTSNIDFIPQEIIFYLDY